MATGTRSSTSMSEPQDSDPFEVAVQKLITTNKAGKTPITLEAMVLLLRAQGQSLKDSYEKRLAEKDSQIADLTARTRDLELKCDRLDQFDRRNSLRVRGIPESKDVSSPEDTDQMVIDLGTTLNLNITSIDIARSHRVGNRDSDRDILVKFVKFENKIKFMKARMSLKAKKPGVYINEDLTKHRVRLFALARRLKREKVLLDTWTKTGAIFVKLRNGEIKQIVSDEMLHNLCDNL